MKAVAPEDLAVLLEMLGDGGACGPVTIPDCAANGLAAILKSLPKTRGRHGIWSEEIRRRAMQGLRDDEKIKPLAREIAALTGQPVPSVRRRLQEMEKRRAKRRVKAS